MARRVWRRWLKFAEILGTVQMVIVLSLIYWIGITLMAIPYKLLADPLRFRAPRRSSWVERHRTESVLDAMKRQF